MSPEALLKCPQGGDDVLPDGPQAQSVLGASSQPLQTTDFSPLCPGFHAKYGMFRNLWQSRQAILHLQAQDAARSDIWLTLDEWVGVDCVVSILRPFEVCAPSVFGRLALAGCSMKDGCITCLDHTRVFC
jgi:hypothetical protein